MSSSGNVSLQHVVSSLVVFMMMSLMMASATWVWYDDDGDNEVRWRRQNSWGSSGGYCAVTNSPCDRTRRCCSAQDVCLTMTYRGRGGTTSKCMAIAKAILPYHPFKRDGDECEDSRECTSYCCQEHRGRYVGKKLICGPQHDEIMTHTCVYQ